MKNITYNNTPPLKIRKRLDELCNAKKYPFDDPIKYKQVFFPEYTGKLIVVEPPPDKDRQRNCFAYALDHPVWVKSFTIAKIMQLGTMQLTNLPNENDIAIYYDGEIIKHGARYVSENKVVSKWAGGPVMIHDNFMCPATYGNTIRYYKVVRANIHELINQYLVAPNA